MRVSGRKRWGETLAAAVLFVAAFLIYRFSPQRSITDSKYALLTSEALVVSQSWDLAPYLPGVAKAEPDERATTGFTRSRHLRRQGNRLLYFYPPGTSLLSAPAVAILRRFGYSTIDSAGKYDGRGERRLQAVLAAGLTAFAVVLVFWVARKEVPRAQAVVVAVVVALGTSFWGCASRAMWMHTWGAVVLTSALFELLRWEDGAKRRPIWLGTLLSAAFWIRPTNALVAVAFAIFVGLRHRTALLRLCATGAAAFSAYLGLSLWLWGRPLPLYHNLARALDAGQTLCAVAGQLVSPRHGILVFTPILLAVFAAVLKNGLSKQRRGLGILVGGIVVGQLLLYSQHPRWWGSGTVVPRFLTDAVPFLAWLSAHAWRRYQESRAGHGAQPLRGLLTGLVALFLIAASIAAQATGALAPRRSPSEHPTAAGRHDGDESATVASEETRGGKAQNACRLLRRGWDRIPQKVFVSDFLILEGRPTSTDPRQP